MAEANVKNIEGLEAFAGSIARLRESTRKNTDDIREQLQRVSRWLDKELPEYWGNQLRMAQIRWGEARDELLHCQAKTRAEDETSCLFQRKALDRATQRRNFCEQKVKLIPQLANRWEQFLQEIALSVRQLEDLADSSLPLAASRLDHTLQTLKQYLASVMESGGESKS
jgi:hypothetical protein